MIGPASALHFRQEARTPAWRWSPPRGGGPKCGRWSSGLSRAFPDCSWLERALKHPRSTVNASSGLAINDMYIQKKSVRLVEVRASFTQPPSNHVAVFLLERGSQHVILVGYKCSNLVKPIRAQTQTLHRGYFIHALHNCHQ